MLFAFLGCKKEAPTESLIIQKEEVKEIYHRIYIGECLGYCDTELIIDSTTVRYIQNGWDVKEDGEYEYLPTLDSTYLITLEQWYKINSLIEIDDVMKLDSIYQIKEGQLVTEAYYEIKIITNQREHKIKFPTNTAIIELDSLNKFILNLKESLQ